MSLMTLRKLWMGGLLWALAMAAHSQAWANYDHQQAAYTAMLRKHVVLLHHGAAQGVGSAIRYAAVAQDRAALKAVLDGMSAVTQAEFDGWTKPQQKAFLINAYNAFTIEYILTKYPNLSSIKDLGSLLANPWKKKWVPLLGQTLSLDAIEHEMLRKRGVYDDPRIHFAVNCASIGCPMLREEAYVADKLDAQLDDQARRFMSDRSRNRYNAASGKLELSKIFDWYGEDFKLGHQGIRSVEAFAAKYADRLADPADHDKLRGLKVGISYLDYDWKLNDAK